MVTLSGLMRTVAVTKNPATAIISKITKKRVAITFKNGDKLHLTWRQFTFFRDHYEIMRQYQVENIDGASFRVRTKKFEFVGSPIIMCVVHELESGNYDCDCQGKVVLDVGGFQGESAVFFSGMGANKVIIYEPVTANHQFIKENVRLNHVNAEIHDEGVGDKNGVIVVPYGEANNCFGISQEGPCEMEIKVRNVADVIDKSGADLAKFDCEGAEKYLVNVPLRS
jgi:FkbM family methyltransferase